MRGMKRRILGSCRAGLQKGTAMVTAFLMATELCLLPISAAEVTEFAENPAESEEYLDGAFTESCEEPSGQASDMEQVSGEDQTVSGNDGLSEDAEQEIEETGDEQDATLSYNGKLRYLYVDDISKEAGRSVSVMVSLEESETIEDAALELVSSKGNVTAKVKASRISGSDLVFETPADLAKGIYGFGKLSLTLSGEERPYVLDLKSIDGIKDASFGIDEVPVYDQSTVSALTDEDGEIVAALTGDEAELQSGIISMDVQSSATDAASEKIGQAILSQAGSNAPLDAEELAAQTAKGKVVVVLDPGHDDTHAGARSHGLLEEKLTMTVANYCKSYLESNYSNVQVYLTRTSGSCPYPGTTSTQDNANRVDAAARVKANAYVSIHFNTTGTSTTSSRGAMVFYPNSNYNSSVSADGKNLASEIQSKLVDLGLNNNGIKIRNSESGDTYSDGSLADYYGVIRRSKLYGFPGVIVEHAFLNNDSDASFCSKDGNLKKLAEADAKGIAKAMGLKNQKVEDENGKVVNKSGYKLTAKLNKTQTKASFDLTGTDSKVKKVYFNVYSVEDKMDDLATYYGEKESSDEWTGNCNIDEHETAGKYMVFAYTVNSKGKATKVATSEFTVTGPTCKKAAIKSVNISKGTFQVRAYNVTAPSGLKQVQIQVTNMTGKKKAELLTAKKKGSYYYVTVKMSNHGYATGKYKIQVIAKDKTGIEKKVLTKKIAPNIPEPTISASLKSKQTKISITAKNAGFGNEVESVKFKVRSVTRKKNKNYEAKKTGSGNYTATVKVSDFGFAGKYQITCYRKIKGSTYKKVGAVKTVKVSDITGGVGTSMMNGKNGNIIKFSSFKTGAKIKSVSVKVWPKVKKAASYTYEAEQDDEDDDIWQIKVNYKNHKKKRGTYKYEVTVKLANGVKKLALKGSFELGKNPELYQIEGASSVTIDQMMGYYNAHASYPAYYADTDAGSLRKFCKLYLDECKAEGIKAEVAFCQAMKETNFLRYGGDVKIEQHNFAGLGATGGGARGNSFSTVQLGIRAQVQHLKAYASDKKLVNGCVDERFENVTRNCAPYVEWLGIQENPSHKGWATDPGYGNSIVSMISELKGY